MRSSAFQSLMTLAALFSSIFCGNFPQIFAAPPAPRTQEVVEKQPALKTKLLMPAFRQNIQSRDPKKQIKIRIDVDAGTLSPAKIGKLEVEAALFKVGNSQPLIWSQRYHIRPGQQLIVLRDAGSLKPGEYTLLIQLLRDGQVAPPKEPKFFPLDSKQYIIRVLPPAATEVTFDDRGIYYINGKAFFLIGLYHVGPRELEIINNKTAEIRKAEQLDVETMLCSVKNHGFNSVIFWRTNDLSFFRLLEKVGLYAMPEVGLGLPTSLEVVEKQVKMADGLNNIPLWYGKDEPKESAFPNTQQQYELFSLMDPHRPIASAINRDRIMKPAMKFFDFLIVDPYPLRTDADMSFLADTTAAAVKTVEGVKPVWVALQSWTCSRGHWNIGREPTAEELRCQAYTALIHGATGLLWYSYWSHEEYKDHPLGFWFFPHSKTWEYMTKLNTEIKRMSYVIMQGKPVTDMASRDESIHSRVWSYNGQLYMIAVNVSREKVKWPLGCKAAGQIEVMFEKRRLVGGHSVDTFEPLSVHVYRYKPAKEQTNTQP